MIFCPLSTGRLRYLLRNSFCSKNMSPPTVETLPNMPQLDFREALSTPEQNLLSVDSAIAASTAIFPNENEEKFSAGAVRFSRSTWTNVVFVTIASIGAVFCAFYFFNGAQVLRAAAAWPNEFLYPRPADAENFGAEQPNAVDRFSRTGSDSRKSKDAPFDRNYFPSSLTQPGTNLGAFNPGAFNLSNPGAPFSSVTSPITQLNFLPPGADSLFQSFYQRALALVPKPVKGIVSNTVSSTRRRVSTVQQRVAGDVSKLTNRTTSAVNSTNVNTVARSTVQSSQQMTNQTTANLNSSLNSVRAQSQMMMNTSHGTGLGTGLGTGVGSALGGVSGAVHGIGGGRH